MKKSSFFINLLKYSILLILGGSIYYGIEILYRGYSHFSMFLVGGMCLIGIGLINEIFPWDMPFWKQVIIGDVIVLVMEFVSGCILNLWLHWNVWDYSAMPFNLLGQICLAFAFLWLPIVALAIVVDDYARWILLQEEKPHYNFHLK